MSFRVVIGDKEGSNEKINSYYQMEECQKIFVDVFAHYIMDLFMYYCMAETFINAAERSSLGLLYFIEWDDIATAISSEITHQ